MSSLTILHRWQVYAVVYDSTKRVLIIKKKMKGYFFHSQAIEKDGRKLNGAGALGLNGGQLDEHTSSTDPAPNVIEAGAKREFQEETGESLTVSASQTKTWDGGRSEHIHWHYSAAFFEVKETVLTNLMSTITNNLKVAQQVAKDIQEGKVSVGTSVTEVNRDCKVQDDELESVQIMTADNAIAGMSPSNQDWYINILKYLKTF